MSKVILSEKDILTHLPQLVKLIKKSLSTPMTTTHIYERLAHILGYDSYLALKKAHSQKQVFDLTIDKDSIIQSILQLDQSLSFEYQAKIISFLNKMDWALALNAQYLNDEYIISWNHLHLAMFDPKEIDMIDMMSHLHREYIQLNTSENVTLNFFNLKQDQNYDTNINIDQNKILALQEYISHKYVPSQKEQWVAVICAESKELLQQIVYKLSLSWLKPYVDSRFNDCLKQMTNTTKHYLMEGENSFLLERKRSIENKSVHWLFQLSPDCSNYRYIVGIKDDQFNRKVSDALTYYHQHSGFIQKLFTSSKYLPNLIKLDDDLYPCLTYLNRQFNQSSAISQYKSSALLSMHFDNNEPLVVEDVLGKNTIITGVSGSGKSIFVSELIIALRKNNKSIIMLDANSGFDRVNNLLEGNQYQIGDTGSKVCLDLIRYRHLYKNENEFRKDAHYYLSQVVLQYEEYKAQIDNILLEVNSTLELIEIIPQLHIDHSIKLYLESHNLIEFTEFTLIDIQDYYSINDQEAEIKLELILRIIKQYPESVVIIDELLHKVTSQNIETISSMPNQTVKVFQGINEINKPLFNIFDKMVLLRTSVRFRESIHYAEIFNDSRENVEGILQSSNVFDSIDEKMPFMINYFHIYDKNTHQFQSAKFIARMYQKSFFFWRNEKFYDINVVKEILSRMTLSNIKEIMLELDIKHLN